MNRGQKIHGVFDAPKDCSDYFLKQEADRMIRKYVDHFELDGWVLRSPIEFHLDAGKSAKTPLKNHYVITAYWYPLNKKEDRYETITLPKRVVDKLVQKMPEKVRILGTN